MNTFKKDQIIPIASDHGGFALKQYLIEKLTDKGYQLFDMGTHSEESMDYPDAIHPLAATIDNGEYPFGIIMCGSGQGASMTANKYPRIRAGLCWDMEQAKLSRMHNDANIIALPGRFIDFDLAVEMVITFLNTAFEGGRHRARINKIPRSI